MTDTAPDPLPRRMTPEQLAAKMWNAARTETIESGPGPCGPTWRELGEREKEYGPRVDRARTIVMAQAAIRELGLSQHDRDAARLVAVAAERERIRAGVTTLKVTLARPGNGPAHAKAVEVVPLPALLRVLGAKPGSARAEDNAGGPQEAGDGDGTPGTPETPGTPIEARKEGS